MIWSSKDECLSLGGGKFVLEGEPIPAGALTPERIEAFKAKGWVKCDEPVKKAKRKRGKKKSNVER